MKLHKIVALAVLTGASSASWAWGCGGYTPPGGQDPDCVVTWDFTDPNALAQRGDVDPELAYTGSPVDSSDVYPLVVRGFTVDQSDYGASDKGTIRDGANIYATDFDGDDAYGRTHAIGVHGAGEDPTHWATKIDNVYNSGETYKVRDAVLLDFENCLVSIDEISLFRAYHSAKTSFTLWAWTGDSEELNFSGNNVADVISASDPGFGFFNWQKSDGGWDQVARYYGNYAGTFDIDLHDSDNQSRYFVLIAGSGMGQYDAAWRLAGLQIACDPTECEPSGSSGVPVPGTLALLGIGAVVARRRFGKLA